MAAAQDQAQFDAYLATLAFMPDHRGALTFPVSYTHLTLPTILRVCLPSLKGT